MESGGCWGGKKQKINVTNELPAGSKNSLFNRISVPSEMAFIWAVQGWLMS